jgi:hypothetical protein
VLIMSCTDKTWAKDLSNNTLREIEQKLIDWRNKNIICLSVAFYNVKNTCWAMIYSNSDAISHSIEKQEIIKNKIESLKLEEYKETAIRVIGFFLEVDTNDWILEQSYRRRAVIKLSIKIPKISSQTKIGITPRMIRVMMRLPLLKIGGLGGNKTVGYYRMMKEEEIESIEIPISETKESVKEIFQSEWETNLKLLLEINFIEKNKYFLSMDNNFVFMFDKCGNAHGDVLMDRKGTRGIGLGKKRNDIRLDFSEYLEMSSM